MCIRQSEQFRGAAGKVICIKDTRVTSDWIKTVRKVRDSFNKNLKLQLAAARFAAEEGLIKCDIPICVTCTHWEVKEDEPLRNYGYCRSDNHELREYDESCRAWEPCS